VTEPHVNQIPNGGALRVLPGGLTILRYEKHEWRDELDGLSAVKLRVRTGKVWGSKFLGAGPLHRLVEWMARHVEERGWTLQPGTHYRAVIRASEFVGLVEARKVHTIRIVSDGRFVHAYPIEDQ
jgi:hypothetical protein